MFSINVKTSSAVTYPIGALGRTLIFDTNGWQLPENHTFYILLDAGDESHGRRLYCAEVLINTCMTNIVDSTMIYS